MAFHAVQDAPRGRARLRTRVAAFLYFLWLLAVAGRLVYLQVFKHDKAADRVAAQNQQQITIQAERGTIYDRNGRILARSLPARTIIYSPNPQEPLAARFEPIRRLADKLGLGPEDLERIRKQLLDNDARIRLKGKADPDLAAQVCSTRLGITAYEDSRRFYPLGTQAAHVLGGVKADGSGAAGVESKFNPSLMGRPGTGFIQRDARQRRYGFEVLAEPRIGRDLTLTLDQTIQYIAQSELESAVAASGAAWGTVIVCDTASGEILAMASAPTYDPNVYSKSPEAGFNPAVQLNLEPGSTFKIVTAAALLESRAVSATETFDCSQGSIAVPGGAIRDHKTFGRLDFAGVIIHSSNVGTVRAGRRLEAGAFAAMIRAFGFDRPTGIELPGESGGKLRPVSDWSGRSQASLSIGYEIAVTPLQMLQAVNVVANRGRLVPPRIVRSVQGGQPRRPAAAGRPILSAAACQKLAGILERVVEEGTGREAEAEGYRAAGKTGTTQINVPGSGGYGSRRHIASFVGYVPADAPRLSLVVILADPKTEEHYGGQVAAPVFREISRKALLAAGIPPRRPAPGLMARLGREADR